MSEVNEPQENYQTGYISIFRSIRKHWIWQDAEKLKWWLDLLLEVNHSENDVVIGYEVIKCKRGQTVRSLSGWATRWGVSKDTARNFLSLLVKHNMIERVNLGKTTLITICNYDSYQAKLHVKQTRSKRQANATYTQTKNDNNDNNVSTPPDSTVLPFNYSGYEDVKEQAEKIIGIISNNFHELQKMEQPLTAEEACKLVRRGGNIIAVLRDMDNHAPLLKKYKSAYKTALNWLENRKENV